MMAASDTKNKGVQIRSGGWEKKQKNNKRGGGAFIWHLRVIIKNK